MLAAINAVTCAERKTNAELHCSFGDTGGEKITSFFLQPSTSFPPMRRWIVTSIWESPLRPSRLRYCQKET